MQLDMHYYGTYAMARAAGIHAEPAGMIATCAQFVDDNVADGHVTFDDGARIDSAATAHHAIDIENLDDNDQRQVWVPFHFIPGNEGNDYTERLKCRKDSLIAREMAGHAVSHANQPYSAALIGITAHVYADTFSHYGFSGVSSQGNKVENDSFKFQDDLDPEIKDYITGKARKFFERRGDQGGLLRNIKSWFAEKLSGALGHGAVATYPDRPYLNWSFDYEREDFVCGITSNRNNQETFLEGCEALHGIFHEFAKANPPLASGAGYRAFSAISGAVADILSVQGDCETRIAAWQAAAGDGRIFGTGDEVIPEYGGEKWNRRWKSIDNRESFEPYMEEPVWLFYQAASIHRNYVLRELLPKHGLIVD